MTYILEVCSADEISNKPAQKFAEKYGFAFSKNSAASFVLEFSSLSIRLLDQRKKKPIEIKVEFASGTAAHRLRFGGGKSQAIAKAVGISANFKPRVLDATAGLGKDAFVLAGLGCEVLMLERFPVAFALLEDGLNRAKVDSESLESVEIRDTLKRLSLCSVDSKKYLERAQKESVNVVYLDPMFPERHKSAMVKKDMLVFQDLVGADTDSDDLLESALAVAENRVVVKRSLRAPCLANKEPTYELKGKSSRFDIYTKKSFDRSS